MDSVAERRLYTVEDLMMILAVSRATVYRLTDSGRLKVSRIGRSIRVSASDLEDYLVSIKT